MRGSTPALRPGFVAVVVAALALAASAGATAQPDRQGKVREKASPLFAVLRGTKEVGPRGERRAGDLDGRGSFSALIHRDERFCFAITVTGIATPTMAHIHKGVSGRNGPIVIPLEAPSEGDPGASSGCVDADPKLLKAIRARPGRYYANVHNGDFPAGAVRGQLFQANARQDR